MPEIGRKEVMDEGTQLNIFIRADSESTKAIRQLLLPWRVNYVNAPEKARVVICYGTRPNDADRTVLIPQQNAGMDVNDDPDGSAQNTVIDVVAEYNRKIQEVLDPTISRAFKLATGLPIQYRVVPAGIRNRFLRTRASRSWTLQLGMDVLRNMLVTAVEKATKAHLTKKKWNGREYVCLVTHDVETRAGLHRARVLKRIEERYDVPSTWFVPAQQFDLKTELLSSLSNNGEIGAHDLKHDGKLALLSQQEIIRRVSTAKQILSDTINNTVVGFRSPLLSFRSQLIQALARSSYLYDSSMPTWEPLHPATMMPHGVGTVYPLEFGDMMEIPVTLPQDHQMINVLGLTPCQTRNYWMSMVSTIKTLHGAAVLLVHSDYAFAKKESLPVYEDLVAELRYDNNAWVTTPRETVTRL